MFYSKSYMLIIVSIRFDDFVGGGGGIPKATPPLQYETLHEKWLAIHCLEMYSTDHKQLNVRSLSTREG